MFNKKEKAQQLCDHYLFYQISLKKEMKKIFITCICFECEKIVTVEKKQLKNKILYVPSDQYIEEKDRNFIHKTNCSYEELKINYDKDKKHTEKRNSNVTINNSSKVLELKFNNSNN